MRTLLLLVLAAYCATGDNTYFTVEQPEPLLRPFEVFWLSSTPWCSDAEFKDLLDNYGIIYNNGNTSDRISVVVPETRNEYNDKYHFLRLFEANVVKKIPDENYDGLALLDVRSWKDIIYYSNISKCHAMEIVIQKAVALRPNAKWGYYGYPYGGFNGLVTAIEKNCINHVSRGTDKLNPIWSSSEALFPRVIIRKTLTPEIAALVKVKVTEAKRVQNDGVPILPLLSIVYNKGRQFLSKDDLIAAVNAIYQSRASGFIITGRIFESTYCDHLRLYLNTTLGPIVAKYTKPSLSVEEFTTDIKSTSKNSSIITFLTEVGNNSIEPVTNSTEVFNNLNEVSNTTIESSTTSTDVIYNLNEVSNNTIEPVTTSTEVFNNFSEDSNTTIESSTTSTDVIYNLNEVSNTTIEPLTTSIEVFNKLNEVSNTTIESSTTSTDVIYNLNEVSNTTIEPVTTSTQTFYTVTEYTPRKDIQPHNEAPSNQATEMTVDIKDSKIIEDDQRKIEVGAVNAKYNNVIYSSGVNIFVINSPHSATDVKISDKNVGSGTDTSIHVNVDKLSIYNAKHKEEEHMIHQK